MNKLQIKNLQIVNILFPEFIKNRVDIGSNQDDNHPCMLPFLKNSMYEHSLFNLNHTYNQILIVQNKLHQLITSGKEILFISHEKQYNELISNIANQLSMPAILEEYPDDLFKKINTNKKERTINNFLNTFRNSKYWMMLSDFQKMKLNEISNNSSNSKYGFPISSIPNAVFIIDPNLSYKAINDAQKYGVLIFSIVNSNDSPLGIDYFIPANNQEVKSVTNLLNQVFTDSLYSKVQEREKIKDNTNYPLEDTTTFDIDIKKRTIFRRIINSLKHTLDQY